MCKTSGRIRMRSAIVLMPIRIRIRIWIGINMEIRIRIGIKSMPICNTALYTLDNAHFTLLKVQLQLGSVCV